MNREKCKEYLGLLVMMALGSIASYFAVGYMHDRDSHMLDTKVAIVVAGKPVMVDLADSSTEVAYSETDEVNDRNSRGYTVLVGDKKYLVLISSTRVSEER